VQLHINSENENQNENEVRAEKQKTNTDVNDPTNKFASGVPMLKDSEKHFLKGLIANAISERSSLFDGRGLGKIKISSTIYQLFFHF
jgi:hypothetical protein